MVQVQKLHAIQSFVAEENFIWTQISVHHIFLMNQLKQVNDLKAYVN